MANSFRNELHKHKIGQWEWQHRLASTLWCSNLTGFNKEARQFAKMVLAIRHKQKVSLRRWERAHRAAWEKSVREKAEKTAAKAAREEALRHST